MGYEHFNPTCKYNKIMKTIKILSSLRRESGFIRYFRSYLDHYDKKDRRVIKQALDKYIEFSKLNRPDLLYANPGKDDINLFANHLIKTSRGSGAASTFARFKKVASAAVKDGVIRHNPCTEVRCPSGTNALVKDILSENEIRALVSTTVPKEHADIKRAFIFSLYTGLRFCDIKGLTYRNIDFANKMLVLEQSKTKGRSSRSIVHIPLRDDIISMISQPRNNSDFTFKLPSHPSCMKFLKKWTYDAGIYKHITWHCARHSFATNILTNGADIRVVADLLGHSGLKYVEIYTRAIDSKKAAAVNSLPSLRNMTYSGLDPKID